MANPAAKRPAEEEFLGPNDHTTKRPRASHTIDSDDEDEEDDPAKSKYEILNDDDVEGQEEGAMKVEEGVRITPFNIQEELDEGHFDTDGNFFLDKDKEVKDAWLDGLDQFADEDFEKLRKQKADEATEGAAVSVEPSDTELYKIIIGFLTPGESVGKALRRLGAAIKPTQRMKKGEKATVAVAADPIKKQFDLLTSAADKILQKGNLEIYQETYEKIQHKLSKAESRLSKMQVDDGADIFGEVFVPCKMLEGQFKSQSNRDGSPDDDQASNRTLWEYKWLNTEAGDVHGPYSSEQMVDWVQQDFFKDGVFVRKAGAVDAPFYSSKRVDFELYI